MLAEVIAWGVALVFMGRFACDHLIFPVVGTVLALMDNDEGDDGPPIDTYAMGFDLSPSRDYDDFDDEDDE
jgi:hypothetical protein